MPLKNNTNSTLLRKKNHSPNQSSLKNALNTRAGLEILREIFPDVRRLAIIGNVEYAATVLEMGEAQAAARTLGLEVVRSEIRRAEDIAHAFEALKGAAQALCVCPMRR
jgi:ABC-type uncharacterized transport system substrate-binding protein